MWLEVIPAELQFLTMQTLPCFNIYSLNAKNYSLHLTEDSYQRIVTFFFFFPLALQPQFGPWPTSMKLSVSLQFTKSQTVGRTPWKGDQLVARPLPVHIQRDQTSMPWVGFETTIAASELAKTVHASDRLYIITVLYVDLLTHNRIFQ
jgi:hypothetical protein